MGHCSIQSSSPNTIVPSTARMTLGIPPPSFLPCILFRYRWKPRLSVGSSCSIRLTLVLKAVLSCLTCCFSLFSSLCAAPPLLRTLHLFFFREKITGEPQGPEVNE